MKGLSMLKLLGAMAIFVGIDVAEAVVISPLRAEGFGAASLGGTGGSIIRVTTLDDDLENPPEGSLRWAVSQKGPRIVEFAIAGTISLKDTLTITEPFLTIDGSNAPGQGICIRDYNLLIENTHDVIVRYIRIRRGDVSVLEANRQIGRERPKNSEGLDCVSINDSKNILFDHCSLSWSCDEIFGIVRGENITLQWCLLAEPLSNPHIHPYGDNHAYGLNISASQISVHHCLLAHYVMRGPQFEANDVTKDLGYNVKMEAVNNVLFDYEKSGARYRSGVEEGEVEGTAFQFHFVNNLFINKDDSQPDIQADTEYGAIKAVKVFISGNIGPHRINNDMDQYIGVFTSDGDPITKDKETRDQLVEAPLFQSNKPITKQTARNAYKLILEQAGCSIQRDAVDMRILQNVKERKFGLQLKSQDDVGGWPNL